MSALIVPPVTHVMVEPARIPMEVAAPRFTNDGEGAAMTVTVAVPKIVPLVALTLLGNVPVVFPAVKRPVVATMVPGGLTVDQVGVIATTLPFASFPTAVNCCVAPMSNVGFGVTVIVASGPAVTMTVAVAVTLLQVTDTVIVPAVVPAVNSPVLVIVPPPETDQIGFGIARTSPSEFFATVVNCCVPFTGRVVEVGEMVIDAVTPGSLVPLHPAVNKPASATAARTRARRARGASAFRVRLLMTLFIELLLP
jgi:hypothetical protein